MYLSRASDTVILVAMIKGYKNFTKEQNYKISVF